MGYSRAVQAGPMIWVAGCVGINSDGTYPQSLVKQTQRCVDRITSALSAFDADLTHVVKVRIYTTAEQNRWDEIAEVMGPTFANIRPANVLVGVDKLVDDALIEIEAEAYLTESST